MPNYITIHTGAQHVHPVLTFAKDTGKKPNYAELVFCGGGSWMHEMLDEEITNEAFENDGSLNARRTVRLRRSFMHALAAILKPVLTLNTKVILKTFNGTISSPEWCSHGDNYWLLIGHTGHVAEANNKDGRALVLFDESVSKRGLNYHNAVPNSL